MREIVINANEQLAKAAKDPKNDLEKMKRELQLQVNGMQEGIRTMIFAQVGEANRQIAVATGDVAKEKALDIIVDKNNVFAGYDKLATCEDVTPDILKRLTTPKPAAPPAPAKPATP